MIEVEGASGVKLRGGSFGDPNRPPVLFLHGGGQTRHAWQETAAALARDRYVVTFDLRGHGESDWSRDGDYTLNAFAEDVRRMARLFARKPAIVGASLGGISAMLAEGEGAGGMASALVLVDIAVRLEPEGVAKVVGFMSARPDGFASLEEAAEFVAAYLPHRPRPSDLGGLGKNLRRGDDGRYRWHWDPAFLGGKRPNASHQVDRLSSAARALRIPTLLVRGKRSDLLSERGVEEFLDLVPGAEFVDVAEAGHMVAGDRNDIFTAAILPFLDRVA